MMIKFTKMLKLFLLLTVGYMICMSTTTNASKVVEALQKEECTQKFEVDRTGALISYDGDCKNVVIPDNVRSIAFGAFMEHNEIESVVLPEGLLTIDECAFYGCSSLKELDLPNSLVNIGRLAFGNCSSLERIRIGDNLSEIMELFACGCMNLSDIEVSDNNTHFTADSQILYDKNMESLILCPQRKSGRICIPDSVVTIKEHAFLDCADIEEVVMGKNVKYIDEASFYGCKNLKKVYMNEEVKKIRSYAFAQCSSLEKIRLGANVNYIGNGAFFECDKLRKLVCLSDSVQFGDDVFDDGLDLTVYAPDNSDVESFALKNRYNFEVL